MARTTIVVNSARIRKKIASSRTVFKKFKKKSREKLTPVLETANEKLVEEFEAHPASVEMDAGPDNDYSTYIKGGAGNLPSLLGIANSAAEIKKISKLLTGSIKIKDVRKTNNEFSLSIKVEVPTIEEINEIAVSPDWIIGDSWIDQLERGVSNVACYFFANRGFKTSTSGYAIQIKKTWKNITAGHGTVSEKEYISKMLRDLGKEIKKEAMAAARK